MSCYTWPLKWLEHCIMVSSIVSSGINFVNCPMVYFIWLSERTAFVSFLAAGTNLLYSVLVETVLETTDLIVFDLSTLSLVFIVVLCVLCLSFVSFYCHGLVCLLSKRFLFAPFVSSNSFYTPLIHNFILVHVFVVYLLARSCFCSLTWIAKDHLILSVFRKGYFYSK